MNPVFSTANAKVVPAATVPTFWVRRSYETPYYYQLSLQDARSNLAHWAMPLPLKQLAKRPVMLWLLPSSPALESLACVEAGPVQLAPARIGASSDLRAELEQGLLRLNFDGQRLRGYYRLQCLPSGSGQLWQLSPIGYV